jgi:hypothetical protein
MSNFHCFSPVFDKFALLSQFLNTGNDIAARETCPCIWIVNPRETGKVLQHVMNYGKITPLQSALSSKLSFRQQATDPGLIAAGVVPGTDASKSEPGGAGSGGKPSRGRSISGELGKICVYTGNSV